MYEIPGNQIGFRVTEEEKQILNSYATRFQEAQKIVFTSSKPVFMGLLALCQELENKLDLAESKLELAENTIESITKANEINTESTAPTIENIEKEVVEVEKLIERPLAENEILLSLTGDQLEVENKKLILETIRERRAKKYNKEETESEVINGMLFNDDVFDNYSGQFYTGISSLKRLVS